MLNCRSCGYGVPCACGRWADHASNRPENMPVPLGGTRRPIPLRLSAVHAFFSRVFRKVAAFGRGLLGREASAAGENLVSRPRQILDGLRGQNELATFKGREGFWVQGDCVFIEAPHASAAVLAYRRLFAETGGICCSHNHHCGSILREKERFANADRNAR